MRRRVLGASLPVGAVLDGIYGCGDIVLYDGQSKSKIVVNAGKLSNFASGRFTPIAVMVVPSSHDVYGTGEAAAMSLLNMSYRDPDKGTTSNQTIDWGNYQVSIPSLPDMNYTSVVDNSTGLLLTTYSSETYFPSDEFTGAQCISDPTAYYYSTVGNSALSPSPYLSNGARNPIYYSTEVSAKNALADFSGKGNTELLCSLATAQSDWKTYGTQVLNNSGEGYLPAACCCWRFRPDGTQPGDWYMPAFGELGYMVVRRKSINESIQAVINTFGSSYAKLIIGDYYSSSTSRDTSYSRVIDAANGHTPLYAPKNTGYPVRAYIRIG